MRGRQQHMLNDKHDTDDGDCVGFKKKDAGIKMGCKAACKRKQAAAYKALDEIYPSNM